MSGGQNGCAHLRGTYNLVGMAAGVGNAQGREHVSMTLLRPRTHAALSGT